MRTNNGIDFQSRVMGEHTGDSGTASATTATSMTDSTEAWTTDQWRGHIVFVGPNASGTGSNVYGVVVSNTATVLTIDKWYDPACVDEQTEILTHDGWKTVHELRVGDLVLGLDHAGTGLSRWEPVQAIHVYPPQEWAVLAIKNRTFSSISTLNHRWPIESADNGTRKWETSETLNTKSCFVTHRMCESLPSTSKYLDDLVALIGWFCTEGSIDFSHGKKCNIVRIYQSIQVNSEYVEEIRSILCRLFGPSVLGFPRKGPVSPVEPMWREAADSRRDMKVFVLNSFIGALLQELAPNRVMSSEFITALTQSQLDLLWETWRKGDGTQSRAVIGQKSKQRLDALQMVLALRGRGGTALRPNKNSTFWFLAEHTNGRRLSIGDYRTKTIYTGQVWCPTTPSGAWLARREGRTFFTGNSPGGAAGTTPNATGKYVIGSGGAPAYWTALTENATAPAATDASLAGELVVGTSAGLERTLATFAHTYGGPTTGNTTYTLTKTFTLTGATARTLQKLAVFNASRDIAGQLMVFETAIPNPPTLVQNDQCTTTHTVNL